MYEMEGGLTWPHRTRSAGCPAFPRAAPGGRLPGLPILSQVGRLPGLPRPCGPPASAAHPQEVPVSRFLSRPGVASGRYPFPTVKYFYCLGQVPRKGLWQSHCEFLCRPHTVHRTQVVIRN